jgi:hydroxypyruvate reductase/glycerate 2-kinase
MPGGLTGVRAERNGVKSTQGVRVTNRARLVDHGERRLREVALDLGEQGLRALSPAAGLRRHVQLVGDELVVPGRSYDLRAFDKIVVLGAGKASVELALGLEELLGERVTGGLVVVPGPPEVAPRRIRLVEATHPLPSQTSFEAGRELVAAAEALGDKDLAICVFTGGSSALASLPPPGVSGEDKTDLHRLLLASGMPIVEINTVRKHVSRIKGGRLARVLAPAPVLNLTVSDVVGDPLDCICDLSVQDTSSVADALAALSDYELLDKIPISVRAHLEHGGDAESPRLEDLDIETVLVARGRDGSDAVIAAAESLGYKGVRLGELLEGEAAVVGGVLATLARQSRMDSEPWPCNSVVVGCGGECTVSLGPKAAELFGKGGPSQEAAIGAALALSGVEGVVGLFLDTDGSDGGTDIAGGLVDGSTAQRAREQDISLRRVLTAHDAKATLESLGDAVATGFTQTNANDLVVMVIA